MKGALTRDQIVPALTLDISSSRAVRSTVLLKSPIFGILSRLPERTETGSKCPHGQQSQGSRTGGFGDASTAVMLLGGGQRAWSLRMLC